MCDVLAQHEDGYISSIRIVNVIGGPYDGKKVAIDTLEYFGHPVKYYMRIDDAESAVYAHLSPDSIGYVHTVSDG